MKINRYLSLYLELKKRLLSDGGFSPYPGTGFRANTTCWAVLALSGDPDSADMVAQARSRLAESQLPEGNVSLASDHPEIVWLTSLSILAWHRSAEYQENKVRAADFLIHTSGTHPDRSQDFPGANDPSIKGWPWIADTHSWVEPTAMAVLALKLSGYGGHARVKEGIRLLMDRQLRHGGWNYGSTAIYGRESRPMPHSTGIALNALKGYVRREDISKSLDYLNARMASLKTPLSLAWSILGLGAWQARPDSAGPAIDRCINNQPRYGIYDTTAISLLILTMQSSGGLEELFMDSDN